MPPSNDCRMGQPDRAELVIPIDKVRDALVSGDVSSTVPVKTVETCTLACMPHTATNYRSGFCQFWQFAWWACLATQSGKHSLVFVAH